MFSAVILAACATPPETTQNEQPPAPDKVDLYKQGYRSYLSGDYGRAENLLIQAASLDSTYCDPFLLLGQMHYERATLHGANEAARKEGLSKALMYYGRVERLGNKDSEVLERLCEAAVAVDDNAAFLTYAARNARFYPYDRQYYNLSLAYFNVEDFENVITTLKEATQKFKSSNYIGSFYRQLGRAYMRLSRNQTAERVFNEGLEAVDRRMRAATEDDPGFTYTPEYQRLVNDKIGMLLLLKGLHQLYKEPEKLKQVERKLRDAGYRE
jgi:tetratricopeptide (TPR) repeat protein